MAEENIGLLLSSNICAAPLITNIYYMYMYVHAFTYDSLTYSRNLIQQAIFVVNIPNLYLNVILCQLEVEYVVVLTNVSMAFVALAISFVQIAVLDQCKRNIFRNRSRATMISNGVKPINERDRFALAGSITVSLTLIRHARVT